MTARIVGLAGADPLFARIRQEAEEAARREPELALFLAVNVLNHDTLEGAVSHRVASRLDHRDLPAALIRQTFEEAIARDPSIGEAFRADIMAVADRDPACLRMMEPLLYFKGFQALQAYRLSHWLLKAGRRDFALSLQSLVSAAFGVDINPAARIGKGMFLDHATSLVVGETTVIEDNVSILQGVTLGGTGKETGDRHPKIRHGVLIGAGAKILGNIEIGYCARVAAGSVVIAAGAAQQDGRRRSCAHRGRSGLRRAGARHEPDPRREGARGVEGGAALALSLAREARSFPRARASARQRGSLVLQRGAPSWQSLGARLSSRGDIMDKAEIVKLQASSCAVRLARRRFRSRRIQSPPKRRTCRSANASSARSRSTTRTATARSRSR